MGNRPTDDIQTREQGLRALLEKATPGPWANFRMFGDRQNEVCRADNYATGGVAVFSRRDDADLAVAAVNALPHLLTRISALERALDRLGSMEAFKGPRTVNADRDAELLARIDFARATLDGAGERP